ncbi:site-specific DNA-methyltransferase [Legionella pneumophila]|uniref:site-specific DNA-methyltransferase n=1 Tax=Legionella pneumophila TaxID=446 RepID=UPI000875B61C|nr:site-specific DNA-methyltransferase [Legionella pneumophila]AOW59001.1 hypothetical protein BE843_12395 [Legionella pneumophila subsp. pneumophila]AOW60811.1 hypothetical protein BE844_06375 [Legionella pneumophila subsp. pneumophila]AOW66209.1 hypothetical protein BE846_04140 [Legionella pneumophila subsp. pneumophila]
MQKLKMHTPDITHENIEKIADLFPNCITETRENGALARAIDFDQLRQELSSSPIVDGIQERYQLNWPGKHEALVLANTPTSKTLRPCREESVDFDTTKNLFIEGDNLEALKLLQEVYLNKIKMIYIDPPYNTGSDFIYNDKFRASKEYYDSKSQQIDSYGNRMILNTESKGKFHSDWLSMMYPRLKLARNLLSDDGVIFISIDDNEVDNLRKICDEIFGESNFVSQFIHKNNSNKNQAKLVSISTEYFLCYAKQMDFLRVKEWRLNKKGAKEIASLFEKLKRKGLSLSEIETEIKEMYKRPKFSHLSRWNKVDENGVFKDSDLSRQGGPKDYTIINPFTGKPCCIPERGWGKSREELIRLQSKNLIWYGDEDTPPGLKDYINSDDTSVPDNFWYYDNSVDTRWIKTTFGELVFENPKPLEMIKNIIEMVVESNTQSIILDFFAGSSTTAHAVMQLNAEDGGNRRFIMVQIPQLCNEKSEANKQGFKTIADISKKRMYFAGKEIKDDDKMKAIGDVGFRILKIDASNMKEVYYTSSHVKQNNLNAQIENIQENRTAEDLLFQVLLDLGLDLSLSITQKKLHGKTIYFVDSGNKNELITCFDMNITEALVKQLATYQPEKIVFRDTGFETDSLKINVEQIFKYLSTDTEVKVL